LSTAFAYACEATEDPLGDAGSTVIPGATGGAMTGGGAVPGGAQVGSPTGGGAATGGQAVPGGVKPGGTPGTAIPGGPPVSSPTGGTGLGGAVGGSPSGLGDAGVPGGAGDSGMGSGEGGTVPGATGGDCPGLPAVTDFVAKGPFDAKMFERVGPDGTYVLYRPDTKLGANGLKHPVATWGNGILTDATWYQQLLGHLASHGFVIIACPSSSPERPCLNDGMEWLLKQNTAEGPMKGKLDTSKEITLGYSWGGGASIDTANRPNVKATVSFHGMPPRESDPWSMMKSPLLLFSSTGDDFVSVSGYVMPNYNSSKVPTYLAILQEAVGHLYVCDSGSACAAAEIALGGPAMGAIKEQAPAVAWLRYWVCGDQGAKKYFFGSDCTLCKSPWKSQSKPSGAFN
jgi:hypothetical protein